MNLTIDMFIWGTVSVFMTVLICFVDHMHDVPTKFLKFRFQVHTVTHQKRIRNLDEVKQPSAKGLKR